MNSLFQHKTKKANVTHNISRMCRQTDQWCQYSLP